MPTDEKISAVIEATAINDADLIPVVQNVSTTPVTRAKTGTLVKAWLKAYFDTLYPTKPAREVLAADRTYYVNTAGSDSNDGLTSGAPFLTIQKAYDTFAALDLGSYNATIQLADGTYTTSLNATKRIIGGTVTINGNSSTPANVIVSITGGFDFGFTAQNTKVTIQNLEVRTTTGGDCIYVNSKTMLVNLGAGMRFGACANAHIRVIAGCVTATQNYAITGSAQYHYQAADGGFISIIGSYVTVSGSLTFTQFALSETNSIIDVKSVTFSTNVATGTRYYADLNGVIYTYGGGATFFPGGTGGSTATGGQYA